MMSNAQHTPEAMTLADNILKAAGSGLRSYSMHSTREAILKAAQDGISNAQADLLYALEMVRDADNDCHKDDLNTIPPIARAKIDAAIANARGQS